MPIRRHSFNSQSPRRFFPITQRNEPGVFSLPPVLSARFRAAGARVQTNNARLRIRFSRVQTKPACPQRLSARPQARVSRPRASLIRPQAKSGCTRAGAGQSQAKWLARRPETIAGGQLLPTREYQPLVTLDGRLVAAIGGKPIRVVAGLSPPRRAQEWQRRRSCASD